MRATVFAEYTNSLLRTKVKCMLDFTFYIGWQKTVLLFVA